MVAVSIRRQLRQRVLFRCVPALATAIDDDDDDDDNNNNNGSSSRNRLWSRKSSVQHVGSSSNLRKFFEIDRQCGRNCNRRYHEIVPENEARRGSSGYRGGSSCRFSEPIWCRSFHQSAHFLAASRTQIGFAIIFRCCEVRSCSPSLQALGKIAVLASHIFNVAAQTANIWILWW